MRGLKDLQAMEASRREKLAALLELAAVDDVGGFPEALAGGGGEEAALADGVGFWYGRSKAYEPRTPLMVAATYGSTEVMCFLLGLVSVVDVNRRPGVDGVTALHCAASGGSPNAVAVVKMLLAAGADPAISDSAGRCPADVILAPPASPDALSELEALLGTSGGAGGARRPLTVLVSANSISSSPPLSSSPDESNRSPSSGSSSSSPIAGERGKKEYPVDPTLPDIRSSVYATDEFRMFAFKVRPCSRAYSHDWTECPFVHPGENARRRDPRKHSYSAVACPNFRRPGGCPSGDNCEFSHGVFESWLHPSQYRTRLCKEGAACARRICFFAHREDELRAVPHNNSAGLLSPRASSSAVDMTAAAALGLLPGSPTGHFAPLPMSPSTGNYGGAAPGHWPQGSRLRSSFNASDVPADELGMLLEWEAQYLGALCLPPSSRSQPRLPTGLGVSRSIRPPPVALPNFEDMFAAERAMLPRFLGDQGPSVCSPAHKSAILNQLHQQKSLLSPINTSRVYSLEAPDPSALFHSPLGGMSPRSPRTREPMSPINARVGATAFQWGKFDHQQLSSLVNHQQPSSLINNHQQPLVGSPRYSNASWGSMGSPVGKVNWGLDGDELVRLRCPERSRPAEEEPDVSWVQSLVSQPELNGKKGEIQAMAAVASEQMNMQDLSNQADVLDQTVLGAWLEHMQLEKFTSDCPEGANSQKNR